MTYTKQIGPIPHWIKALRAPGYKNIFQLCDPRTIYGTEQMFGDWHGELLVLAKDFAPACEVERLVNAGTPAELVYRHNDDDRRYRTGLKSNRKLADLLFGDRLLIDGRQSENCRAVYGSACFFLKSGSTSQSLENWRPWQ